MNQENALSAFPPDSFIIVTFFESCGHQGSLDRAEVPEGVTVQQLPKLLRCSQYEGLKYSDDDSDACWLAKLLRLGLLPQGYIYPKEERPIRDLLRKRSQLVHQRTSNIQSIQNLMARNRGCSLSANRVSGQKTAFCDNEKESWLRHEEKRSCP
jgi:hypothetical protein